ncbi:PREDICTED: neutrophil defensin 4-like [Propithecus coquereli]|uniref:Mammalian defensins domain-containing protein n=1 Tax=Propithecus coquereli TaxID=379532 RepID=A0A2K6FXW4_PROCO|nr:PREDICTED: neutrophil defensin 4-like [Propithecus coquereli]
MRTLALLAALLLVTLQAQAGPLQERDEEIPPQELPWAEDPDVAITIAGDKSSGVPFAGSTRGFVCYCRRPACRFPDRVYGYCLYRGVRYAFCCS